MESAGIQDVLTKIVGSRNPFNVVRATFNALHNLMTDDQVRRLRGVEVAGVEHADAAEPAEQVETDAAAAVEPAAEEATPAAAEAPVEAPAEEAAEEAAAEAPAEEAENK